MLGMCLAIPGQITDFIPDQAGFATVDVGGVRRRVNVELLEDEELQVGDWVLLHVGFALSKVSEEEAQEQLELLVTLAEMEQAMEEVQGYAN